MTSASAVTRVASLGWRGVWIQVFWGTSFQAWLNCSSIFIWADHSWVLMGLQLEVIYIYIFLRTPGPGSKLCSWTAHNSGKLWNPDPQWICKISYCRTRLVILALKTIVYTWLLIVSALMPNELEPVTYSSVIVFCIQLTGWCNGLEHFACQVCVCVCWLFYCKIPQRQWDACY